MLAAGSGITPMLSLITAIKQSQQLDKVQVQLLYWVKQRSDAAFVEYFEKQQQYPNFNYQVFYTQETPNDERLNAEHLALVDDVENSTIYACGPSGFVASVEQLFENAPAVLTEAFSLTNESSADDIGYVNVTLTQSNKVIAILKASQFWLALNMKVLNQLMVAVWEFVINVFVINPKVQHVIYLTVENTEPPITQNLCELSKIRSSY